ncbi:class I SAM-dependent methyltransferase [Methylomonas methanica]|uniref:Methyltransferase type 11 n=1 Tax=Methylomonas methanica TaxID=421 RepID=A0A177MP55_METMH|nr:class I SAM-dependent methyltransferase [Methylomonas methanica]OAI07103.1 methyltransferase type 11 [Methylomonas methanica]
MGFLHHVLSHPLTRGFSVDDPLTTSLRREIIEDKAFLRALYSEWYQKIVSALPVKTDILELGSGAGFFEKLLPNVITSEIFETPGVKLVADACDLPFLDGSLNAIVMTDVFHHIPNVRQFLLEATRCVKPGGKIVMIEPWRTRWSEWVYTHLHPEPFSIESGWEIPNDGPLSGANGALPWIVFERDRKTFESDFPQWRINVIELMMPSVYLLSGGVSMRSFLPAWIYRPLRTLERYFGETRYAMFAFIELERIS